MSIRARGDPGLFLWEESFGEFGGRLRQSRSTELGGGFLKTDLPSLGAAWLMLLYRGSSWLEKGGGCREGLVDSEADLVALIGLFVG